jgi:hypothetical protein
MTDLEITVRQLGGVTRQTTAPEAKRPRPLPWLGKRLLALAIASGAAGYAFHLFGTWPLGVIAIATPIGGWVLGIQRNFGVAPPTPTTKYSTPNHTARVIAHAAEQADHNRRFGMWNR